MNLINALNLSFSQRLRLRIFGSVYVEHRKKNSWNKALPHYLAKCKKHGYFIDYPHGRYEKLVCPECLEEDLPDES